MKWLGAETDWEYFGVFAMENEKLSPGWVSPASLRAREAGQVLAVNYHYGRPAHPPLYLRHLERFPLGTRYNEIIARVKRLLTVEPIRKRLAYTRLLVDKTGVGAAVVDGFEHAGIHPISIHGGSAVTPDPMRGYRVPKRDLVSAVQILLQNRRLKIARSLPETDTLRRELRDFRVKIDPRTAHDSYEHWRENEHDDLTLAVAMACWFREHFSRRLEAYYIERGSSMRG